ncbi:hypothetical protein [Daejeonella sp.]|uniref:hypothetical protein n=1 Tax=Daejeonella sp. TaxID=2805397 RepID=UPI0030BAFE87
MKKTLVTLNLKQLYENSKRHLKAFRGNDLQDFRLEQAEQKSENEWDVVVSFLTHDPKAVQSVFNVPLGVSNPSLERVYKRLLLDSDGELIKYLIYK